MSPEQVTPTDLSGVCDAVKFTFSCGIWDGKRSNENWKEQQLFGLDFDGGITYEEFKEQCDLFNLKPIIVYNTFSHRKNAEKFRALFLLNKVSIDPVETQLIIKLLQKVFPTSDKSCKDLVRIYFPGKQVIYFDETATFTIAGLVQALLAKLKIEDAHHYSRNAANVLSDVSQMKSDTYKEWESILERFQVSYIYIGKLKNTPGSTKTSRKSLQPSSLAKSKHPRNYQLRAKHLRNLVSSCALAREFDSGNHISHNSAFHLACNLYEFPNGEAWFKQRFQHLESIGLKTHGKYLSSFDSKRNATLRNPIPSCCSPGNCPFFNNCGRQGTNIQHQMTIKRKNPRRIYTPAPAISKESAREALDAAMAGLWASDEQKTYLVTAPTGLGKTEAYIHLPLKDAVVALPTHKLKEEVITRYNMAHSQAERSTAFIWPERPNIGTIFEDEEKALQHLEKCNLPGTKQILETMMKSPMCPTILADEIKEYFQKIIQIHKEQLVFCTHAKAIQLFDNKQFNTFIFDEDALPTILQHIVILNSDIDYILRAIQNDKKYTDIYDFLISVQETNSLEPKINDFSISNDLWVKLIQSHVEHINSSIINLLHCKVFQKSRDGHINAFRVSVEIPKDKKIIVLSATANQDIYKALFENLEIVEIPSVQLAGKIILHPKYSYSRTYINRMSIRKVIAQIETQYIQEDFNYVITHKLLTELRDDGKRYLINSMIQAPCYFGALEGINSLKGQKVAIFGTPHKPSEYFQLLHFLLTGEINNENWENLRKQNQEWEYSIMTSPNEEISQIHLREVLSELEQAIGRVRLIDYPVDLHVYTNFPVANAQLEYDV